MILLFGITNLLLCGVSTGLQGVSPTTVSEIVIEH